MDEVEMLSQIMASAVAQHMEKINNQTIYFQLSKAEMIVNFIFFRKHKDRVFHFILQNFNYPALDLPNCRHKFQPSSG
jgi:hypothetical protein